MYPYVMDLSVPTFPHTFTLFSNLHRCTAPRMEWTPWLSARSARPVLGRGRDERDVQDRVSEEREESG